MNNHDVNCDANELNREGIRKPCSCGYEELVQRCITVLRAEGIASVSLLQRRLHLGYIRAALIMDDLEQRGIVSPVDCKSGTAARILKP